MFISRLKLAKLDAQPVGGVWFWLVFFLSAGYLESLIKFREIIAHLKYRG